VHTLVAKKWLTLSETIRCGGPVLGDPGLKWDGLEINGAGHTLC